MIPCDPVLLQQLPAIQKIIADETWLEGERRGCYVPPSDCVVRENVCQIILRVGQQLRDSITTAFNPGAAQTESVTRAGPDASASLDWEI